MMDAHINFSKSSFLHSIITIVSILIITLLPASHCDEDDKRVACTRSFECGTGAGNQNTIGYPFWGGNRKDYCGRRGFELKCQNNEYLTIEFQSQRFRVQKVDTSAQVMTVEQDNMLNDSCPEDIDLNYGPFISRQPAEILELVSNCSVDITREFQQHSIPCSKNGENTNYYYGPYGLWIVYGCETHNQAPLFLAVFEKFKEGKVALKEALKEGFDLYYEKNYADCSKCRSSGGVCGSDPSSDGFQCYKGKEKLNWTRKILIGFGSGIVGIAIMCMIFYFYQCRKKKRNAASTLLRNISSDPSSMADVEKGGNLYGVHLFSYFELEEATNNFDSAKELGDGGFGTVYYGKLRDGRVVAVKRLYENNFKRVEQFMNEVVILTRIRHRHLVSLYGCTSRHSRELLLVYEYVPNGTVADHLHGECAKPGELPWPVRLKIAIETASALTYLHASEIIHRDVKTNNILLDNDFCVKVADFGLSRLFPTDVTHVSTAPQGTPGYVDPEYHECYQLTYSSDVFSFGVVLIELISSKPAVDITRHRHEINLSNMAINKIQNHALHELVDQSLGFESDSKVRQMITAVAELAFQCLQGEKGMRPSMVEVLESLKHIQSEDCNEGKAEEVDIPSDDVVLLKSLPQLSPDSVTINWVSRSTTPNTSN